MLEKRGFMPCPPLYKKKKRFGGENGEWTEKDINGIRKFKRSHCRSYGRPPFH
jgi:hypothetical protein